ncbi:Beta-site APP-cleaving enzyme [Stylosanthes scabra]|uniref:Beta-site APP-cleaving enzyme n=1 Tax=Stylosanthes scabra TaxID=79078 RepID=A0ABU6ZC38_9FABA|nr:Beta-site APP-cleaving enzyme [Stylosanthes scabra]
MTYAFLIPCLLLLSLVPSKSHNIVTLNNTLLTNNNGGLSIPPLIVHHRDSPQSPFYNASMTIYERRIAAAQRSINRVHNLMSMWNVTRRRRTEFANDDSRDFSTNLVSDGTEYIATIYLGTPPVKVTVIMDTGSAQNWVKDTPVYDASKSTTYRPRFCEEGCPPRSGCEVFNAYCRYRVQYADDSFSTGTVSSDNIAFDSNGIASNIGNLQFGYAVETENFDGLQNEDGGVILDSGSTYTSLGETAYAPFAREMRNQMKVQFVKPIKFFDICFKGTKRDFGKIPTVMFEFDGGHTLTFPKTNTYVAVATNIWCLAILLEKDYEISVVGSFQMRNILVGYDLANHEIAFAPTNCNDHT